MKQMARFSNYAIWECQIGTDVLRGKSSIQKGWVISNFNLNITKITGTTPTRPNGYRQSMKLHQEQYAYTMSFK